MTNSQHLIMISMITILFFMMNFIHPIYAIIMLLTYTMLTCLIMSMWKLTFIYSIMMFMIMISGLLIIFLYFASLISNEKNKILPLNLMLMNMIINLSYLFFILKLMNNKNLTFCFNHAEIMQNFKLNAKLMMNIMFMFKYPYFNFTMLNIVYLLMTLFMVIKISSIKSTSMRKIN